MTRSAAIAVTLLCACAALTAGAEDSKWVWGGATPARLVNDNHRAESLRDRELVEEFPVRRPLFRPAGDYQPGDRPNFRPATRVTEVDSLNRFGPQTFAKPPRRVAESDRRPSTRGPGGSVNDFDRPFGPGNGPDRFGGPNRPGNFGPDGPGNFGGPSGPGFGGPGGPGGAGFGGPGGPGGAGFGGPGGPGGNGGQGGPAILTGPVPSWEQGRLDGPFQGFDRCKCAHSLNCISPGIQFGHCGEGKMYCCHNSIHEGGGGSNLDRDALGATGPGSGPGIGPGAGIGPGVGGIGPGIRPGNGRPGPGNFDRPFPNGERPLLGGNGIDRPILVGPGGPTGIVSEGLGGRPFAIGGVGGVRPGGIGPGGIGPGGNRPFLPDGSGIGAGERPLYGQGGNRPGQFGGSGGFNRPSGFNGGQNGFNGGVNGGFNGGSNGINGGFNGFNGGSSGFNGGSNGFNGGPNGFNGGSNGFNGGPNGFNGGQNGFNGGNGLNGGPNVFNGGPSGFNGGSNGFNGGPSGFNGGPNGFNGGSNIFNGGPNGFTGGPIRGNGGRPPAGFNGGRPIGFNGGIGGNRPFVDYDDDFIGRNTNGKYSVSRYEPSTLNSRSLPIKRDAEDDKEAVVVEAAKPDTTKN